MPYDISEIKKLSTEEKLQIIDELWETIESDEANGEETFDEDPEVTALLQERIEKYERGEGVSLKLLIPLILSITSLCLFIGCKLLSGP